MESLHDIEVKDAIIETISLQDYAEVLSTINILSKRGFNGQLEII